MRKKYLAPIHRPYRIYSYHNSLNYNSGMNKGVVLLIIIIVVIVLFYKQTSMTSNTAPNSGVARQQPDDSVNKSNSLNLSNQGLTKLPDYVLKMSSLEELNISNNRISGALPAEIHNLKNLQILNVSNNQLTGVPAEVGQLQYLEVLDLSNNKLTGLPHELGNLKKLKVLNLSGNDYSKQDLEIIKKDLSPSVKIII